ncbi:hypothetical protein LY76DRAFT_48421 [Colletotrichum caudatum]|nr:hypothetical protein LY76DRAFT_48421 [Colletotrichum caudatum]
MVVRQRVANQQLAIFPRVHSFLLVFIVLTLIPAKLVWSSRALIELPQTPPPPPPFFFSPRGRGEAGTEFRHLGRKPSPRLYDASVLPSLSWSARYDLCARAGPFDKSVSHDDYVTRNDELRKQTHEYLLIFDVSHRHSVPNPATCQTHSSGKERLSPGNPGTHVPLLRHR